MNTGAKELQSILDELDELKLPHMAAELETRYNHPEFVNTGRLELISAIIHAEYSITMNKRYSTRFMMYWRGGMNCQGAVSFVHSVNRRHGRQC